MKQLKLSSLLNVKASDEDRAVLVRGRGSDGSDVEVSLPVENLLPALAGISAALRDIQARDPGSDAYGYTFPASGFQASVVEVGQATLARIEFDIAGGGTLTISLPGEGVRDLMRVLAGIAADRR